MAAAFTDELAPFLVTLTIPIIGIHHIYRAYRIWFKSDYTDLKNNNGEIPENPEALGELIAKIHLGTGILVLAACTLSTKVSLMSLIYIVTPIFIVFRIAMSTLVWKKQ